MADPTIQDAGQQVRLAITLADRLGLFDALAKSRELLARDQELTTLAREGEAAARQRRNAGLAKLVSGPGPVAVSDLLEVVDQTDPWLDDYKDSLLDGARAPRAVALAFEAARMARGHAAAIAAAEGPGLYQRLQKLAGECVKDTAKLPALGRKVWNSTDVPGDAMRQGQEKTWAAMVRAQDRFALVHQLAGLVRSMGGLGSSALLPDGAPSWGFIYKRWDKALDAEQELRRLHSALRLRYAVDQGWEPGLWLAADLVKPEPEPSLVHRVRGWLIPSPLVSDGSRWRSAGKGRSPGLPWPGTRRAPGE